MDALRIDIPLGDFSGINLVGVLGRRIDLISGSHETDNVAGASWYGSAILARVFTNLLDWDVALQGGKVYGGYQLGGAFTGELFEIEIRAEAAYLFVEDIRPFLPLPLPFLSGENEIESHFTAVLGLGHRFENTLHLQAEYLYNGSGDPDNLEVAMLRQASGGSYHLGRHITGIVASYEILPILNGSLAWIFSFSDYSSLIQPGVVLSISDEAEFMFGAMIALGARPRATMWGNGLKSEFGSYPNFYYMEFKYYF